MREASGVFTVSPVHCPRPVSGSCRGLAILRLLAGLALLGLFAAAVVPVRAMVRFQQLKKDARTFAEVVENILKAYHLQYGIYPLEVSTVGQDYYETTTNAALMAIILGTDKKANPLGIDFEFNVMGFIEGGCRLDGPPGNQRLLDPWGNEFHVRMDADEDKYTGAIDGCRKFMTRNDTDPTRLRHEVIVWSKGRPGANGGFEDCRLWIRSWDEEERKYLLAREGR